MCSAWSEEWTDLLFLNGGTGSDFTPVYAYANVLINLEAEEKDLEIKNDDCEKVCLADFLGT